MLKPEACFFVALKGLYKCLVQMFISFLFLFGTLLLIFETLFISFHAFIWLSRFERSGRSDSPMFLTLSWAFAPCIPCSPALGAFQDEEDAKEAPKLDLSPEAGQK